MAKSLLTDVVVLLVVFIGVPVASGQQGNKPRLPSVLLIGDRVYQQFVLASVRDELKDQATVNLAVWPKDVLPNSTNMLQHLDLLLGISNAAGKEVPQDKRPTWDLIHFNAGFGDLIYCVPNLKSHRTLPHDLGGVVRTDPNQYEKNLVMLVQQLKEKAPNAKLVWGNTTPIRYSRNGYFKPGDEIAYNQIAQKVMIRHRVPINDLHNYAKSIIDMDKPGPRDLDPFYFDNKQLHPPVVDSIVRELGLKPKDRKK
ncbi:MAG: SGNH/GDSL hydrolase family protein [Zavarzinella sp.]